jgi:hypothetical protein
MGQFDTEIRLEEAIADLMSEVGYEHVLGEDIVCEMGEVLIAGGGKF